MTVCNCCLSQGAGSSRVLQSGQHPFNMTEAAEYLESLANGNFDRGQLLPIDRTSASL